MAELPNFADADYEPTDEQLLALTKEAFAEVGEAHARALARFRARIAELRAEALARVRPPSTGTPREPSAAPEAE